MNPNQSFVKSCVPWNKGRFIGQKIAIKAEGNMGNTDSASACQAHQGPGLI